MPRLTKRIKWWMRDCRSFISGKRGPEEEPKTIHLIHCRACDNYHRVDIQIIAKIGEIEMPPLEDLFPGGKHQCPLNGEIFYAAQDDWLHLTERQYDMNVGRKK